MRIADILLGSDRLAGGDILRNLKRVLTDSAYPLTVADLRVLMLFIFMPHWTYLM